MKCVLLGHRLPVTAGAILRESAWDGVHLREAAESSVVVTLDRDFPQILALTEAGWQENGDALDQDVWSIKFARHAVAAVTIEVGAAN